MTTIGINRPMLIKFATPSTAYKKQKRKYYDKNNKFKTGVLYTCFPAWEWWHGWS